LHISRDKAIVASRTDMDQAKELTDVKPANGTPGIYDKLLPILDQWKRDYNFVGSYYIDTGDGTDAGGATNWTVSKPFYDQLLAAGNEIGSHSITHPEDTNKLAPTQITAEFQGSKSAIEQNLGHTIVGAAVPGAPELLPTAQAIEQYYTYITGGATLVGAGYPGAIGHLTPNDPKIYIAPNTSFDFTLVGFQHKTAAEAEAAWATEWNTDIAHSDLPIVVWPWHDYGPTNWPSGNVPGTSYTPQMFTDFIARAAQAGSEFVTLGDLAQRVASFDQSSFQYSYNAGANSVSATVGSSDAGKFALDLSGVATIKSVAGWYAYDSDQVFVGKTGGSFTINLGSTPDDVTHITKVADRANLVSVSGDGANLSFSVTGEGHMLIDLQQPAGREVKVTSNGGTDVAVASLVGDKLDLSLTGLGDHTVSVTMGPVPAVNHAPTVPGPLTLGVKEGAALIAQDLLQTASDPDTGETATLAVANLKYATDGGTASPTLPLGLTYDGKHILSVDPNNAAFLHFAEGTKHTIAVTYDIQDVHGASIPQIETITITGINEAPTVAKALAATVAKGAAVASYELLAGATDADDGAKLTVTNATYTVDGAVSGTVPAGLTYDDAKHLLSVDPSNATYADLGVGAHRTIVMSYDVTDEHGAFVHQTETLTINGAAIAGGGGTGTGGTGGGTGGTGGGTGGTGGGTGGTGGGTGGTGGGTGGTTGGAGGTTGGGTGGTTGGGTGGTTGGTDSAGGTGGTDSAGGTGGGHDGGPQPLNAHEFGLMSHDVHSMPGEVYALYDAVFDRPSDVGGQQYWTAALNSGMSLHDLAGALLQSPEGQAGLGMSDNMAFLDALYHSALHRAGDAGGMQYYSSLLDQGTGRADVALNFAFSAENVASIQPALDAGIFTADRHATDVARLYYGLLDRAPDAGGLEAWTALSAGGTPLQSIAQGFLGSSEYTARSGSQSNAAYIDALYENALGRHAEAGGLESWTILLSSGASRADVAVSIAESPEAHQHLLSSIETGWHIAG
jgi:peptidoglycan/xylan/chitin deacetylase (PgdA/CDA1 family)